MLAAKHRKAALDVSINSIVVIVFAVTMLGLGLAFIKGYFAKAADLVNLDEGAPVNDATPENPISVAHDTFTVEKAKQNTFRAKFYNNKDTFHSVSFNIACISDPPVAAGSFGLVSAPQTIDVGEQKEFKLQLQVAANTPSKDYICTLKAMSGTGILEDEQLVIKVK